MRDFERRTRPAVGRALSQFTRPVTGLTHGVDRRLSRSILETVR